MAEPWQRRVEIGRATLYLGDCRKVLPTLQRPDAIVSDPPYGQALQTNITKAKPPAGAGAHVTSAIFNHRKARRQFPQGIRGDDKPFDPEHLLHAAEKWLLWGAHKFGHRLPKARALVWDKVPTGKVRDQGDGEIAACNVDADAPMRIYRLLWDGVCVGTAARHEVTAGQQREHPTQKPEALMAWCLQFLRLPTYSVVCDPYMGAGSTGLAAVRAGHRFVGIELEPIYFEAACRRIEDAQRQGSFFIDAEPA